MPDLPKIVRQRLSGSLEAGPHPDANLLVAFGEHSLVADARNQVVQHLAQCAECREVLFLSTPESAAQATVLAPRRAEWLSWPVLRWSAAIAAIVVVAAAVSLHRQPAAGGGSSAGVQMTDSPAERVQPGTPSPGQKQAMAEGAKAAPAEAKNEPAATVATDRLSPLKKGDSAAASQESPSGFRDEGRSDTATSNLDNSPISSNSARAVPGRAKDAMASSGPMAQSAAKANAVAAFQPRPATILASTAPRWTLTSDGALQRSLDFGKTWQDVVVASGTRFQALASSGADIWVGGSKGALYHSADAGQSWARVQPVFASRSLDEDIIGVEFPDSLHGKLTTSGQSTWTTADGGKSWNKQ